MLYEFLKWLSNDYTMLNIFNYLSLRAVLSVITSLTISFIFGGWYIKKLGDYSFGQYVRVNGPTTHIEKMGTPTMGGGLILISILISTLLWADLSNTYIWLMIFVTTSCAPDAPGGWHFGLPVATQSSSTKRYHSLYSLLAKTVNTSS